MKEGLQIADCRLRIAKVDAAPPSRIVKTKNAARAPRLREQVERRNKANRTGCVGISFFATRSSRRDGTLQHFFSVHMRLPGGRKRNCRFCIDTLGKSEAWRRALRTRAAHELSLRNQEAA